MQPIKRAIRRPEILAKTGLSATTIYNLEKRGEFPQHFMLTPRCAVWFEAEVDAWLDQCMVNPASPAQPSPAQPSPRAGRVAAQVEPWPSGGG
ncbi:MAG TPA: AlpA family phage regulatory protein [Pseudomonas sp.]|uniref:helix-turn-helix transcriptional regulator n=1 Tax=Pseudomonas sp. TaxID=306 RepID=UPI002C0D7344|nr:AlpA family phage regulatory protein [Pseudomonas sp.]HTO18815.1 AlpA family phage regulatory protein [Pseudomonas sp.]